VFQWLRGGAGGELSNNISSDFSDLITSGMTLQVAVDALDRVYITGLFTSGAPTFDGRTLNTGGSNGTDFFLASYDSAGVFRWIHSVGGIGDDMASGLAFNAANDVYLVGAFAGATATTFNFGEATPNSTVTGQGDATVFIAKYSLVLVQCCQYRISCNCHYCRCEL